MTRTILPKVAVFSLPTDSTSDSSPSLLRKSTVSEERIGRIVDQLPGIVWTTDTDLRFTLCLGAALAQLGLQPQQVVGMNVYDFFGTDDVKHPPIAAHHAALVGQSQAFTFSWGQGTFLGTVEPLFDEDGNPEGTVAMIMDVTDQHVEAETTRRRQARALAAHKNESLKVVAAGVAHTLNNLLTALDGYVALAVRDLPDPSPVRSYLSGIDAVSRSAAQLARQMRAYTGQEPAVKEIINFSHLLADLRPLMQRALPKEVALELELAPDLPPVYGSVAQLRQLVSSLLANAGEAIGNRPGLVRVRTQVVEVDHAFSDEMVLAAELPEGRYVWLQVSDTGAGMDEQTQARVFEPFFTTRVLGRGLGLAAARGIVHGHHGALSVSTKPGLGTTFHVFLPVPTAARG
jgi:signal transduction histidine kinase